MQFKVPQNIDKEDQIVGPLTLIQFSYLAIAGALDVLLNQTLHSASKYIFMAIISLIGLALAFVKIQDRPLLFFVGAIIRFMTTPKVRVWHKISDQPIIQAKQKSDEPVLVARRKSYDPAQIEQLTHVLDTHGGLDAPKTPSPFDNVDTDGLKKPV